MQPIALITGITGQDGYYLSQLLLAKGYAVHGVRRRGSSEWDAGGRRDAAPPGVTTHLGDLLDPLALRRILEAVRPTEVYNLAAQSHVHSSFEDPLHTAHVVALGALNLLEAVRDYRDATGVAVRFYQASSSEMFGRTPTSPQNEQTPFRPANPYACAKVHAFWQTVSYRENYGLHACNGILYNHESPRRPASYVSRKITRAAARIKLGLQHELVLGGVDARRDWGYAEDYVEAMWRILQHGLPDDFVVATGQTHSIADFLETAFGLLELDWRRYVRIDERLRRPAEPGELCGDARKAHAVLGWRPRIAFEEIVRRMVEADLATARSHGPFQHAPSAAR